MHTDQAFAPSVVDSYGLKGGGRRTSPPTPTMRDDRSRQRRQSPGHQAVRRLRLCEVYSASGGLSAVAFRRVNGLELCPYPMSGPSPERYSDQVTALSAPTEARSTSTRKTRPSRSASRPTRRGRTREIRAEPAGAWGEQDRLRGHRQSAAARVMMISRGAPLRSVTWTSSVPRIGIAFAASARHASLKRDPTSAGVGFVDTVRHRQASVAKATEGKA